MDQTPNSEQRTHESPPGALIPGVGTIAARNYLGSVLLLGESLRALNPMWRLTALLIDATDEEIASYSEAYPYIDFIDPEALPIESETLDRMKLYYDLTEFATAVKPSMLSMLLEKAPTAMYIDPDIEIFDSLEFLSDAAERHGIALTPHVMAPTPRDGKDTSEEQFLTSGQFNLGFIAVSRSATPFLGYWTERLERFSRIDFAKGYFTDQKWVDAVPSLFDHEVIRDPGCNVAYWNLHQRVLTETDGSAVTVDGEPLKFFHYSGHSASDPLTLSKYAPNTRVNVQADPVLKRLLLERAERMTAKSVPTPAYRWDRWPDGRPVTAELRRGYWLAVDDAVRSGSPLPPAPGWSTGSEEFSRFLAAPVRGRMPRHALLFWRGSSEAQAAFPNPTLQRTDEFAEWLLEHPGFVGSATPEVLEALASRKGARDPMYPIGVNVVGYLAGEFGMGEHSRNVAASLRAAGLPVALVPLRAEHQSHREDPGAVPRGAPYAANVVVVNADVLGDSLTRSDIWSDIQPRPTAGIWAWELPEMPREMASASRALDELWCGSHFIRRALERSGVACPIHVHPWLVEPPGPTHLIREDLNLASDRFLFGFSFDFRSVEKRKNPAGLLDAYCEAFGPDDGVGLVLKTINGTGSEGLDSIAARVEGRPDVVLIDAAWTSQEMRAFYQLIDAYVSLHRSEGTGLTLLAAMAAGTPTVATGWSGNVDFMDPAASRLVPFEIVPVGAGAAPYPPEATWADPDLVVAAEMLRELAADPDGARSLGRAGRDHVSSLYSRDVASAWFAARVEALGAM